MFWSCLYFQTKTNGKKRTHEGSPKKYPWLGRALPYLSLVQGNRNYQRSNHSCLETSPWLMLQMDFSFFNVEIIREFNSTFVAICSATSYPFIFTSRSKHSDIGILKFLVNILSNQDKKVVFIRVDKDVAQSRYFEFMKTCHNMNILVQTKGGYASSLNGKAKYQIRYLLISQSQYLFYWIQVTINNYGALPISMLYVSPTEMIISCVVIFLTYSGIDQYLHINTSKYAVWESTSSMEILKERILMIYPIVVISWDVQILQELLYNGIQTSFLFYTDPIMFGLKNLILVYP